MSALRKCRMVEGQRAKRLPDSKYVGFIIVKPIDSVV
ncbi:Uncharacterised protein [Klebsiella pneumoniae]|uniref:Uncharacterized protein n=1 Tax=Klebsiella pneumoniae TaxID=573 RepID=A0A378F7J2_KLEPN|nr:Uncharacterised protein [Klebsiella pneumoniae]